MRIGDEKKLTQSINPYYLFRNLSRKGSCLDAAVQKARM